MTVGPYDGLSRREREIMMILHRRGSATAREVQERLADPPSYSAVRSALSLLERSGEVVHRKEGRRYVYLPAEDRAHTRARALEQLTATFFRGSAVRAAMALMQKAETVGEEEYEELRALLGRMRDEGAGG